MKLPLEAVLTHSMKAGEGAPAHGNLSVLSDHLAAAGALAPSHSRAPDERRVHGRGRKTEAFLPQPFQG